MPTGTTRPAGARELEQLVSRVIVDMNQMAEFERRPLILSRGEGVHVWDVNGRRYLDGVSGVFVVNVGHGNRRVIDAMKEQLELITFAAPTMAANDRMLELAEALGRLTPDGMDVFKFSNSGSEAIEVAFKIARQYHGQTGNPGKYKILSRYSSYHGATLGAMGATGLPQFRVKFEPMPGGFVHFPAPRFDGCGVTRSCPPCDLSCADCLDLTIRGEGPATVAAVVLEPVMNMAGSQAPPDGYLQRVRDICDEHGVLLIYDEIVTGFGRLGHWFGADRYGVWPDLLVVGKGMTSGYATLSATVIRNDVAAAFRGELDDAVHLNHGHTFGGNPLACAAALAATAEIDERDLLGNATRMGELLRTGLESLRATYRHISGVRQEGLLAAIDFDLPVPELAAVTRAVRDQPLLSIGPGPGPSPSLRLAPPLTITAEEVEELVGLVEAGLAAAAI